MGDPQVFEVRCYLHQCTAVPMMPSTDFKKLREWIKHPVPTLVASVQEVLVDEMTLGHNRRDNVIHVGVHHNEHKHVFDRQWQLTLLMVSCSLISISKTVELCQQVADCNPIVIGRIVFHLVYHPFHVCRHEIPNFLRDCACCIAFEVHTPHILQVLRDAGVSQCTFQVSRSIALRVPVCPGRCMHIKDCPSCGIDCILEAAPCHCVSCAAPTQ
mmetsp:Transcript_54414/g.129989  ORF Transcript_54414/g.129989 Transcript_54414/m.129989 type:complete len:214 (-) Transcript_54414:185-826(-)